MGRQDKQDKGNKNTKPLETRGPRRHNKSNGRGTISQDVQHATAKWKMVTDSSGVFTGAIQLKKGSRVRMKRDPKTGAWVQLSPYAEVKPSLPTVPKVEPTVERVTL